jgi:hypothetical protein
VCLCKQALGAVWTHPHTWQCQARATIFTAVSAGCVAPGHALASAWLLPQASLGKALCLLVVLNRHSTQAPDWLASLGSCVPCVRTLGLSLAVLAGQVGPGRATGMAACPQAALDSFVLESLVPCVVTGAHLLLRWRVLCVTCVPWSHRVCVSSKTGGGRWWGNSGRDRRLAACVCVLWVCQSSRIGMQLVQLAKAGRQFCGRPHVVAYCCKGLHCGIMLPCSLVLNSHGSTSC